MATGVKMKDSCHIACAEMMKCDYLLTTDKRMLKYKGLSTKLINPIDFVKLINDNDNEY
jgi:predicted nucleic acid-binding protein